MGLERRARPRARTATGDARSSQRRSHVLATDRSTGGTTRFRSLHACRGWCPVGRGDRHSGPILRRILPIPAYRRRAGGAAICGRGQSVERSGELVTSYFRDELRHTRARQYAEQFRRVSAGRLPRPSLGERAPPTLPRVEVDLVEQEVVGAAPSASPGISLRLRRSSSSTSGDHVGRNASCSAIRRRVSVSVAPYGAQVSWKAGNGMSTQRVRGGGPSVASYKPSASPSRAMRSSAERRCWRCRCW